MKLWQCFKDSIGGDYYGGLDRPGAPEAGRFSSCKGLQPVDILSAQFLPPRKQKQRLVTGTRDGEMLIWSIENGLKCKHRVQAHEPGRLIPARSGGDHHLGGLRCLRLRDDREVLLSAGADGCIREWEVSMLQSSERESAVLQATELPSEYADNAPPLFRSLDCMPGSDVFLAGTYRCICYMVIAKSIPLKESDLSASFAGVIYGKLREVTLNQ